MRTLFVKDITLASIFDAFGIPKRQPDPATREIRRRDGTDVESWSWWFDITDDRHRDKAKTLMQAYQAYKGENREFLLDPEHPLYWMAGFAVNRAANLHLAHHGATPMRIYQEGNRTLILGPSVRKEAREKLKSML